MITVAIIEDDPNMLDLLASKVDRGRGHSVVFTAGTVRSALCYFAEHSVDVLLVDLGLADGSGLDVIRYVKQKDEVTDIMVISVFGDERNVCSAIAGGATGYLLKDSLPEDIGDSIDLLRNGGAPINPIIARLIVRQMQPAKPALTGSDPGLTEREREILNLIARGFNTAEVAELTKLSSHTVVTHVKKIYRKLHVNSRSEAIYEAGQLGLLRH